MADVFLSYSREDRERAARLAHALEAEGWSVWWDRQIPPGQTFDEVIERALDECSVVVALWSVAGVASRWVRTEAAEGLARGILVPVLIDPGLRIPLAFRRIQAADLTDWEPGTDHAGFHELADAITELVSAARAEPAPPTSASPPTTPGDPASSARARAAAEDWEGVVELLGPVEAETPDFASDQPEAADLLRLARRKLEAAELYEDAELLYADGRWEDVLICFEQILQLDPDIGMGADLRDRALRHIEQAVQERRERDRARAVQAMEAGEWPVAAARFEQLARELPDDEDIQASLDRARRGVESEHRYRELRDVFRERRWGEVIDGLAALAAADPDFGDPDGLLVRAQARLAEDGAEQPAEPPAEEPVAVPVWRKRSWRMGAGALAALVALVSVTVLVAVSVGSGDSDGNGIQTTASDEEPDDQPAWMGDFTGETLSLLGPATEDDVAGFRAGVEPFEEATGASFEYVRSSDVDGDVERVLASDAPPSLALVANPRVVVELAERGEVVALASDASERLAGGFTSGWFEPVTVDGAVHGVPNNVQAKSLVWYSPELFDANGYSIPTTWDELEALAERMRSDGIVPWCVGIESGDATGWPFTDWMEDMLLRLHGPDVYERWVNHDLPFDDPAAREAAQLVGDMWFDDGNVLGGRGSIADTSFVDAGLPILRRECGLHRQADFYAGYYEGAGATFGQDIDVFYLPTIFDDLGSVVLGGGQYSIALDDRPVTLAALEYLGTASYADARVAADRGGFVSPNRFHDTTRYSSELAREVAGLVIDADHFHLDGSDRMPLVVIGRFLQSGTDYVRGVVTVDQFLGDVEAAWP